jgi:putative copper export protein
VTFPFAAAALSQWIALGAMAAWIGGLVLDRLVLSCPRPGLASLERRLTRWTRAWVVVLLLMSAVQLVLRAQTMTGTGLPGALVAVPAVLEQTHFGSIWIVRLAALALALALSFLASRLARPVVMLVAAGAALTTSMTGHAGDRGDLSISVLVDWAHVLAAGAWAGGLVGLAVVVLGSDNDWPAAELGAMARRFSRLAAVGLLVVVLSGTYNAWAQLPGLAALWTSAYGRTLFLKLVLVGALVWHGAVNRWVVLPRLGPGQPAGGIGFRLFRLARLILRGRSRRRGDARGPSFARHVAREAVLVVAVLAVTGALTESTPPRHQGHLEHRVAVEDTDEPFRVTMEGLHEAGGVPRGWTFRPPPGDPARGRQVFRRLECYRCHRVAGERFPPPSGPGPELTDMGAHHPAAYLAESVMNPDAVIVDGPGYTGPDGRSAMPDYRDNLSVAELIDLVAYLKTL